MKKSIISAWRHAIHERIETEQVFHDNEIRANLFIEKVLISAACLMALLWILNTVGILAVSEEYVYQIFPVGIAAFAVPAVICRISKADKRWIKYVMILFVMISLAYLDSVLTYSAPLLIVLPVVLSCRYYSCPFTVITAALTTVFFTLSAYIGVAGPFGNPDLNFADPNKAIYIRNVMLQSFLPRWLNFMLTSGICYEIARCGRIMVLKQDTISKKTAHVETELEMARQIQEQALPEAAALSDSRYRKFDLAAKMIPAKEVGGDFYDFFYPDPEHLVLMVADVADKGIAASLYMMMSKTFLDSRVSMILSPGRVLESVNRQLYERSPKGMFVTVWLGVLNLKTGDLVTANAGHEYPVIKRKDGTFELVKDKHGFVLGGWESMRFPEQTYHLDEGDTLFVYTDGVPEANDPDGQMFCLDRMLASLNRHADNDMAAMIANVKGDIDEFAGGAPQFDDTTMLAIRLGAAMKDTGLCLNPDIEELEKAQTYISDVIGPDRISPLQAKKIAVAVDEIFSNIVNYSDATRIHILCEADSSRISVTFRDDGRQFDPLAKEMPQEPAKGRVGGLGIIITCRTMDSVEYRYENGSNILAIQSNIEKEIRP